MDSPPRPIAPDLTTSAQNSSGSPPPVPVAPGAPPVKRPVRRKIVRKKLVPVAAAGALSTDSNSTAASNSPPASASSSATTNGSSQAIPPFSPTPDSLEAKDVFRDVNFFNLDMGSDEEEQVLPPLRQSQEVPAPSTAQTSTLPDAAAPQSSATPTTSQTSVSASPKKRTRASLSQSPERASITSSQNKPHTRSRHASMISSSHNRPPPPPASASESGSNTNSDDEDDDLVIVSQELAPKRPRLSVSASPSAVRGHAQVPSTGSSMSPALGPALRRVSTSMSPSPSPVSASASPNPLVSPAMGSEQLTRATATASIEIDRIKERMERRQKQRQAQEVVRSFKVGIVLRTMVMSLQSVMPPFVESVMSNESIRPIFNKYITRAKDYVKNFPENECIFVWQHKKLFLSSTPNVLGVSEDKPTLLIDVMLQKEYDEQTAESARRMEEAAEAADQDKVFNTILGKAVAAEEARRQEEERKKAQASGDGADDSSDGYFRISLKGCDNQAVNVKVNADTTISKIVEYYCKTRNISAADAAKVRLVFDDEDIDMSGTVGDTELEEDFTVDVYIG